MDPKTNYLTREGEAELRNELRRLNEEKRPALIKQLTKGRNEGKLRKNADYDDARESLWLLDANVERITETLRGAIIVESNEQSELKRVSAELRQLEQIRLPHLKEKSRKLSARTSRRNVRSLQKKLEEQKRATNENIRIASRRISEIQGRMARSLSRDRKSDLRKAHMKIGMTDLPNLKTELKNINKQLNDLAELSQEHGRTQDQLEQTQARIRELRRRLDTVISPEGETKLRTELRELVEQRRPALAQKLTAAVAQGDLKENADYHDAKEQLGFVEGRVNEIEGILRIAIVDDGSGPTDEVRIGSTVVIQEDGEDFEEEYRIVGSAEANPRERSISANSPIGSALLGKRKGRKVRVKTPDGIIRFKIVAVR